MTLPPSSSVECHVCGQGNLIEFPGFRHLPRVTSDCRPWGDGGRLAFCRHCTTVQKFTDFDWRAEVHEIYAGYDIYAQGGGEEQAVFDQRSGTGTARSQRLLEYLLKDISLPEGGRWLDIGCGNGALLKSVSGRFSGWRLSGSELGDKNRSVVEAIPGVECYYPTGLENVRGPFNVISMVHVFEHVDDPVSFVKELSPLFAEGGWLIIEVPFYVDNPFDLLIADHCSHFSPKVLQRVLSVAGFEVEAMTTHCIGREISCLARLAGTSEGRGGLSQKQEVAERVLRLVDGRLHWLDAVYAELVALSDVRDFGIFGSSIAACFADQVTGGNAGFFVDEDQARVGHKNMGRPILSPGEVKQDDAVYISLPTELAVLIANRLNGENAVYRCPPPLM